jgi:hypothetical protein
MSDLVPVTTAIEFFSEAELKCKGSGVIKLDPRFATALVELRKSWGKPIKANSVCRSPEHNAKVGGNPTSLHMTENSKWPTLGTMAIDCGWRGWSMDEQLKFAKFCWSKGWAVGLHNAFCHIDRRIDLALPELPQTCFLYGEWDNKFTREQVRA